MKRTARPQRLAMYGVLIAASLLSASASAQENSTSFQVEHFEPLPSQGLNILSTAKSDVLPHLTPSAGVFGHYVKDPLKLVSTSDPDEVRERIIAHQIKAEVWASIGLFGFFELGAVLPLVAFQNGEDLGVFGRSEDQIDGFALADLRLVPKLRILNADKFAGFGLAIAAPVHLPVGDDSSFNTDGAVRVEPRLIVDWRHSSGFALAANFGYQLRPEQRAQNIISDDVLRWGVATQIPVGLERVRLIASIFGNVQLQGDREPAELGFTTIGENQSSPMEALGGLQIQLPANFVAQLGAGAGLSPGVGSPTLRAFASIGYTPMITDRDGDGIPDTQDQCPDAPEDMDGFEDEDGCPDLDNDQDAIPDAQDQCPDDAEDKDGFEDEDGCPDPDNDADGILDVDDKCPDQAGVAEYKGCPVPDRDGDGIPDDKDLCPDQPEDFDKFQDDDGCPDPDNDGDGVLDVDDKCPDTFGVAAYQGCPIPDRDGDGIPDDKDLCPDEPETFNGFQDDDGCPDGKETVVITETEIKILEKVFFDTGKDTIQKRSFKLLDTVATVLAQNPRVTKLRVEGHTDDVGNDSKNLDLSKRRARSVMNYLTGKGVSAERLESEGFGEDVALCKELPELTRDKKATRANRKAIEACRADNRRVEFRIIEVNGKAVKATDSVIIQEKQTGSSEKPADAKAPAKP